MKSIPHSQSTRRNLLAAITIIILLTPAAFGRQGAPAVAALTSAEREAAARVKSETIREITTALASDEMQGRGTAQPGGDKAARYIADRFAKMGLKPLGDSGTYLQPIKFRVQQPLPESSLKFGEESLKYGDDFVISPPYTGDKSAGGSLVFVAYGLRDDFGTLDIKNKIVVLIDGPPKNVEENSWKKAKATQLIITNLFQRGATGLIIANAGKKQQPYSTIANYLVRRHIELEDAPEAPSSLPPFVLISDEGAEKLFAGSGITYAEAKEKADRSEFVSRPLKNSVKISIRVKKEKGISNNIVGLLEGSDPKLKEEAIVYSAHYDAFGATADGRIYPGAADNALGVAEMISVAEAFAQTPARPRRSIIFLAVTGEEYGLLGAEHWVRHPTWKIQKVAADFNFDGMGTEVYGPVKRIVGFGMEHSDLGATLESVAGATGSFIWPDPMPEEKSFYRSDHYAFVKKGVPALMLLGGPEMDKAAFVARIKKYEDTDYHQPTDTVRPDWNWDGPRAIAVIGLIVGLRIAEREAMPAWLPSSPFNQPRGTNKQPPEQ
jgi:hypothetical protein